MSVLFRRGQELGRTNGLSIFLKSKDKTATNAAEITYNLYDFTTGTEILLPPQNRTPVNSSIGEYFAAFIVPLDANLGKYRIRWNFRQFTNSPATQILQEFNIVDNQTQTVNLPGASSIELDLVRGLRIMLRDSNPQRNYHFAAPAGEESIDQFTRVFGYLWESHELLEFLKFANDDINSAPPETFYHSLDMLISQHGNWRTLLLTGAMVHAIDAITLNNIFDEFSYSVGGISLDIERSSKYQSMAGDARERFNESLERAKETVKLMRGLKQSRYGIGIRSSFGPSTGRGSLTPRRFIGV